VELTADRMAQPSGLFKPLRQVHGPEGCVPALFLIPVDSHGGVVWRQFPGAAPGVIVNGAQGAHAAVGGGGATFGRQLIMALCDHARVLTQRPERQVQPVLHDALNMVGITPDRRLAALLPLKVRNTISAPGLSERNVGDGLGLGFGLFRELALGDLGQGLLGHDPGVTGGQIIRSTKGDLLALSLTVFPEFALDREGLFPGADHKEEALQFGVADHVLTLVSRRESADHLVIEGGLQITHRGAPEIKTGFKTGLAPHESLRAPDAGTLSHAKLSNNNKGFSVL